MKIDFRDLRTYRQIEAECPGLRANTLRRWFAENKDGCRVALFTLGELRLVHIPTFNEWLARHRATAS